MTSILSTKYVIYILMSLIIVDIHSLSDRRSSGFCSDSERRESLGSGRHGLVTNIVFWICLLFFLGPWSLEGTGWSQTCYFAMFFADSAQTEYCTTFHCLSVRPSVTGVTSHISHIYKGINTILIIRGPIKPCIF